MSMKRRDFLRSSGWFVVGATLVGIPGCGDSTKPGGGPDGGGHDGPGEDPAGTFKFPQGVASGDPRATSVVLWTRVVRGTETTPVAVRVQVSSSSDFATMIADRQINATLASDHTVRVLVTDLAPATTYYYRFVAGKDMRAGRTRTAPEATADVQINLAWVSCQDYAAGHYGAFQQMLLDDEARPEADRIHAVVHLGDMIYETRADGFQTAIDDEFNPIALTNRDGTMRVVGPFPDGGTRATGATKTVNFALTVDDYRHLYKTFLSDPDIQAARERWPFISIWDDHEFTDDCWQSQANYVDASSTEETDQTRRVAASQAWFEYVPAQLTGAEGVPDVPSEAKDFAPTTVEAAAFTTPNADNFVDEPNNDKAVHAITIYRSFRFGKHVELVMTDLRSYRSDHAIPEDLIAASAATGAFFAPRNALPQLLVDTFDQGATANGGSPPATVGPFPNPRVQSPVGTMLGKQQKAWWKSTMQKSDATWKLWGSEVTLMRLRIPALDQPNKPDLSPRVVSADAWDGYPTERKELMTFLKDQAIKNVVVLSGDIHASFAGVVKDDFDSGTAVACELVAAGISSNSLFSFFESATRPPVPANLRALVTLDAPGGPRFIENFNFLLRDGLASAGLFAGEVLPGTKDLQTAVADALAVSDPNTNQHLRYIDTNAQGYGYVKVTADQVAATIVTINRPVTTPTDAGPGQRRTASFTIPKDTPGAMSGATFTGTRPFPLNLID
ncbi:MAG TPA: alkaline phosphatase D family protein [Kofleriaceae bacterium]|nr:alkaline phosphatase D family protein [Kofleriaceae bacterium]